MFLTAANLAHYLIARGIINVAEVVDGNFKVIEAGQNNRNFKVVTDNHRGKFIKQVKSLEELHRHSLQREADCYRWALSFPEWAKLMPEFIDFDQSRYSLILALLPESRNLREYFYQQQEFPVAIASSLGSALSIYHNLKISDDEQDAYKPKLSTKVPWIFTYYRVSYFPANTLSGGALKFGDVLRERVELVQHLERLFDVWQIDGIIHTDIKWENCLVPRDIHGEQLKIIDWELVQLGDTRWDVGSVFQAFLSYWIARQFSNASVDRQQLLDDTRANMPQMFAAIRAFWDSYCSARNIAKIDATRELICCLEFAAVRMLQTAFESLYHSAEMTPHAYALLELSEHILFTPASAAMTLFGFDELDV